MKKRLYISQSAINDFLACKKRYYYRLNFKNESIPTREMFLGILVHKLLENFSTDKQEAVNEIDKLTDLHSLNDEDRGVLWQSVDGFFDNFQHLTTPDDKKEIMFSIPYRDNIYLSGKYDRITPNHMVIDWKSGTYIPFTLKDDVQSILYNYAYKQQYGVEPTVVVCYLRANKMKTYSRAKMYEDMLLDEVLPDMLEDINLGKFPHTGFFNGACRRCTFREFCYGQLEVFDI